jgi:hypothetical protein
MVSSVMILNSSVDPEENNHALTESSRECITIAAPLTARQLHVVARLYAYNIGVIFLVEIPFTMKIFRIGFLEK